MVMKKYFRAGFARSDITPAKDERGTFEIFDPIFFRALYLTNGMESVAFLAADLFVLSDSFLRLVEEKLGAEGLGGLRVLCGASHLGTGPTLFYFYVNQPKESLRQFEQEDHYAGLAARAIAAAVADASPVRARAVAGEVGGDVAYNRRAHDADGNLEMVSLTRYPTPPPHLQYEQADHSLRTVWFERESGRPIVLLNFACHALSRWADRGNISGDYPGRLCQILDERGMDALFFQGELGNIHPVRRGNNPCERIARKLADTAVALREEALRLPPVPPSQFEIHTTTVALKYRFDTSREATEKTWKADSIEAIREGLDRYRHWIACRREESETYHYSMTLIRLGNCRLLHMPGEPFAETGMELRNRMNGELVFILANPSPEAGYLPTREAHAEGGDEPDFAPLEIEAEARIRQAASDLLGTASATN